MSWQDTLKTNEPLSRHTTFKIGGPAEYFVEPETESDLRQLLVSAKERKQRVLIIGRGSNLLADDRGIRAIVVKLSSACFGKAAFRGDRVISGAGCLISRMIQAAKLRSLSGLEFMSGIPGTLGGALVMNAGIHGKNIADLVEEVTVMDYNGNKKKLARDKIKFGYRSSHLTRYIVLGASLRLTGARKEKIAQDIESYLSVRKDKQEISLPSAGCVFRNPHAALPGPGQSGAGSLIDLCGLKGRGIGGAVVSKRHANFIVNTGNARSEDVMELIRLIKKEVRRKFGINLRPEIKIWC